MRRAGLVAVIATGVASMPIVGRLTDERNIRALQRHVGCSHEEARRLYRLARKGGYGAAYAEVFPGRSIPATPPFDADETPAGRSAS